MKNAVELVKNSIKITLLLVLLYNILKRDLQPMASMIDMNPAASAAYMMKMLFDLLIRVCIAFTVIAFGDYLYQRWEYEKELRMTKQEVKDEYKQTEGNPEIKNRIKSLQRQMASSRMMQMDLVIFLRDPLTPKTHEPDVNDVVRLCDTYNIPLATNLATAELLIKALDRGDMEWREVVR